MQHSWSLPLWSFRAFCNGRVIPLSNLVKEQLHAAVAARSYGHWRSAAVCTESQVLIMYLALSYHTRGAKNILVF